MEMDEIIKKVNYYAKLSKQRKLTPSEREERNKFRRLYLEQFKNLVREHLENIEKILK